MNKQAFHEESRDIIPVSSASRSNFQKDGEDCVVMADRDDVVYLGKAKNYHLSPGGETAWYDNSAHDDLMVVSRDTADCFHFLSASGTVLSFREMLEEGCYRGLKEICDTFEHVKADGFEQVRDYCLADVPLTPESLAEACHAYKASAHYKGTAKLTECLGTGAPAEQREMLDVMLKEALQKQRRSKRTPLNLDAIASRLVAGASQEGMEEAFKYPYDTQKVAAGLVAKLPQDKPVLKDALGKMLADDLQSGKLPSPIPQEKAWAEEKLRAYFKVADARHVMQEILHRTKYADFEGLRHLPTRKRSGLFR